MPPLQAAGFILIIFSAATIGGLIAHDGITRDVMTSEVQIVSLVSGLLLSVGAFLACAFGVQRR